MAASTAAVQSQQGIAHRPAGTKASGYGSDDEAVPDIDPNDTADLLEERLQAWRHACNYLESYVSTTEKMQKAHHKEYEKVLKSINEPLREGHHFDQSLGGVAGLFENMRTNTQAIANSHLETAKALDAQVLPILHRLGQEIKGKKKELTKGAAKGAKAVAGTRNSTQKHIELLGQHTGAFDSAGGKVDASHDPYVLNRAIRHHLNRQVLEENSNKNDLVAVQDAFASFEAHVIQTLQQAMSAFNMHVGGQIERQKAMYGDMAASCQNIPPEFEWKKFVHRYGTVMVDPAAPERSVAGISYPNMSHRATTALISGTLERKGRAIAGLGGYKAAYYAVTPAKYLHQYDDRDDFGKSEPSPDLSLYLPDCSVGALAGDRFNVKGKDLSKGKVGAALSLSSELAFRAGSAADAERWWRAISTCAGQNAMTAELPSPATAGSTPTGAMADIKGERPVPLQAQGLPAQQQAMQQQAMQQQAMQHQGMQQEAMPVQAHGVPLQQQAGPAQTHGVPVQSQGVLAPASSAPAHPQGQGIPTQAQGEAVESQRFVQPKTG